MKKLLFPFLLLLLPPSIFGQTQQQCDQGRCSGLGAPVGICTPGSKYTQVGGAGNQPLFWQCGGIPPSWVAGSASDPSKLPLAGGTLTGPLISPLVTKKGPQVDVTHPDFGAASGCNISTDAACSIRAAISYAVTQTPSGGNPPVVSIPFGVYTVASGVTISNPVNISCDPGTLIKKAGDFNAFTIANNNVSITGCTIDGGGTVGTANITNTVAASGTATFTYSGLTGTGPVVGRRVTVTGCTTASLNHVYLVSAIGAGVFSVSSSTTITEAESTCTAAFNYNLDAIFASGVTDVTVSGVTAQNINKTALEFNGITRLKVVNNTMVNNALNLFLSGASRSFIIDGNNIDASNGGQAIAIHSTTSGTTTEQGVINNNAIIAAGEFGIEIGNFGGNTPKNITVTGNSVKSLIFGGIVEGGYSMSSIEGLSFSGNTYDNLTGQAPSVAALELTEVNRCAVSGNTLIGGQILVNGTSHCAVGTNHVTALQEPAAINITTSGALLDSSYNTFTTNDLESGLNGSTWVASASVPAGFIISDGTTNCGGSACMQWTLNAGILGTAQPTWAGSAGTVTADSASVSWLNIGPTTPSGYFGILLKCNAGVTHCDHNQFLANKIVNDGTAANQAFHVSVNGTTATADTVFENNQIVNFNTCYSLSGSPTGTIIALNTEGCGTVGSVTLATYLSLPGLANPPLGSASGLGILQCGSGTTCTAGVISVTAQAGQVVGNFDSTANVANLGGSTLYSVPASPAFSFYQVCGYTLVSTAATTSSTMPTAHVNFTDPVNSVVMSLTLSLSATTNTAQTANAGCVYIQPKAGTIVQVVTTGYASVGATAMAYDTHESIIAVH